jgi:hypothetical protein
MLLVDWCRELSTWMAHGCNHLAHKGTHWAQGKVPRLDFAQTAKSSCDVAIWPIVFLFTSETL